MDNDSKGKGSIITEFIILSVFIIPFLWLVYEKVIKEFFALVKLMRSGSITNSVLSIAAIASVFFIIWLWERRDDLFNSAVSFLCAPFDNSYGTKKDKLLNYRKELKEMLSYISRIADKSSKDMTQDEFYEFVQKVEEQNERLKDRQEGLEHKDAKVSKGIEVFFFVLGLAFAVLSKLQ